MTKINVISGFLGAGKTTLISKLLKDKFKNEKVVLVENEFGEIGIDSGFLKDAGIDIKEMNSGCICCTLKGDFEEALNKVIETYHPDRIIIEPSGVGKLSDVLAAIETIDGITIESYSTVVDAPRCKTYHKNFKEFFDDQIAHANCVILSKTQKASQEKLEEALQIIQELNPHVKVITTPWDELTSDQIFEAMALKRIVIKNPHEYYCCDGDDCECHDEDEHDCCCHDHDEHECGCHDEDEHDCCCHDHDEHECGCYDEDEHDCCCHDHDEHEHHHHHGHHHHHADEIFDSIGIQTVKKFTKEEIENALQQLDEHIVRAKGIVQDTNDEWIFFDYVPGDVDIRKGSANYTGVITVIGDKVNEQEIKALFGVN